ncbi:hypothetical protein GUJ93_ZPchr0002g25386 [Zizania palustris]|uniref:Uncharacterized protein n=1 Tax=Zizania palustris TaxID=103762 RepID=A0A8J5RZL6_ZIZPA|nr:hypothetical protein GUJ93_ZPchr0002g25386 [Zizania palustris]
MAEPSVASSRASNGAVLLFLLPCLSSRQQPRTHRVTPHSPVAGRYMTIYYLSALCSDDLMIPRLPFFRPSPLIDRWDVVPGCPVTLIEDEAPATGDEDGAGEDAGTAATAAGAPGAREEDGGPGGAERTVSGGDENEAVGGAVDVGECVAFSPRRLCLCLLELWPESMALDLVARAGWGMRSRCSKKSRTRGCGRRQRHTRGDGRETKARAGDGEGDEGLCGGGIGREGLDLAAWSTRSVG